MAEPSGLAERLAARLAGMIESGLLKPGERLVSIRAGAAEHGVGKNTVAEAYERLVASGHVEARRGAGFFVLRRGQAAPDQRPANVVEAVDHLWLLREQLDQRYAVRVGDGRPPQSWMEGSELGRHLRPRNLRERPVGAGYTFVAGYRPLCERIAVSLGERGIAAAPSQILLTVGASHAFDIVIRHLAAPGETVLVDSPGYYPLFGKLRLAGIGIASVRRTPEGPDPADLAARAEATGARVFFTQSLAHNPTGTSITLPVAHRVLQVAAERGLHVVDCDPFADVLPPASPRLATLDQLARVIVIGTYAKTLSAGLRVGYVAARPDHIAALTDMKMLTVVNSSAYAERLVHDLIASGQYRRHLLRLRDRIAAARERALRVMERLGIGVFGAPEGGYYLWGELPEGTDDRDLARRAGAQGILIAPGSVFAPDGRPERPGMRVNIAYAADPRFAAFWRGVVARPG